MSLSLLLVVIFRDATIGVHSCHAFRYLDFPFGPHPAHALPLLVSRARPSPPIPPRYRLSNHLQFPLGYYMSFDLSTG